MERYKLHFNIQIFLIHRSAAKLRAIKATDEAKDPISNSATGGQAVINNDV